MSENSRLESFYINVNFLYVFRILELNNNDSGNPFQPRVVNARDYHLIDFSEEQVCFIVISTSGDGESFNLCPAAE